jgi:hypothetical protein
MTASLRGDSRLVPPIKNKLDGRMNHRTKLIQWQRITVVTLLLAVATLGSGYYRAHRQATVTREALQRLVRSNLLREAEREVVDAQHEASAGYYNQTIQDLQIRVRKYEDKYGHFEHKGCGLTGDAIDSGPFGPGAFKQRIAESMNLTGH